jgi:hypothetical protein
LFRARSIADLAERGNVLTKPDERGRCATPPPGGIAIRSSKITFGTLILPNPARPRQIRRSQALASPVAPQEIHRLASSYPVVVYI